MNGKASASNARVMLVLIVAAGLSLRLINIDGQPLWGDEALTLVVASAPLRDLFLSAIDPTPGLYYAMHKMWIGPAATAWEARSLSLVFGVAIIPATYVLAKEAGLPRLGSAAMVAFSFPLIDYSQEARAYTLLTFLVTLSLVCHVRWSKRHDTASLTGFVLTSLLALYSHVVAIFWVAPAALVLFLQRGAQSNRVCSALALLVLAWTPEAIRIRSLPSQTFVWLEQADLPTFVTTLATTVFPLGQATDAPGTGLGALIAILLFGALIVAATASKPGIGKWWDRHGAAAPGLAIGALAPLAIWAFGAFKPIFLERTILFAIPVWMTLVAWALKLAAGRPALALFLMLQMTNLWLHGTIREKPDWRLAAAELRRTARPGDAIVVCPAWQAAALRHALGPTEARIYGAFRGKLLSFATDGPDTASNWPGVYRRVLAGQTHQQPPPQRSQYRVVRLECRDDDLPPALRTR